MIIIKTQKINEDLQEFGNMVMSISMNYLKNKADAENITQEVFLKLFLSSKEFKSYEHKKAWLIRVTTNLCKDFLKSASKRRDVSLEEVAELSYIDKGRGDVLDLIRELPAGYRKIVYLYYYEGYKTKDIAKITGLSKSNVSVSLHRARKLLKEKIERSGDYEGQICERRI
ncbi:RNA polymerase sigma factor [Acetivibrio saccincola]|nr:sigma-70 family RNA polymerase sigma factor [Acetivibrio saccincola]HOA96899.1 sigma-70 family RNA polymerase sigma factor [Acetivibrio saccincola]HQD27779.1 sigma-70 family RNA polymerase sigma factor [Acetivibrio saccincola]